MSDSDEHAEMRDHAHEASTSQPRAFRVTAARRATLEAIGERAEWHDADGAAFCWIATEDTTGDPVIYVYDRHEAFVLRPDGTLELSPEPESCPMGCGRTTEDPYGGPCKKCWENVPRIKSDSAVCPTCGEVPWSHDAGPCSGLATAECARQAQQAAWDEADYLAGLEREARLREC